MKALWTAEEARRFDALVVEATGLPSLILMENAGWGAFHAALSMCPDASLVTVVCGPGQNGGDGWVVARLFAMETSAKVRVVTVGGLPRADAKIQRNAVEGFLVPQASTSVQDEDLRALFDGSDIIVDAMFGTGLSREVGGEARRVVEGMNASTTPVLALDLPSGLDANTGQRHGVCVHAKRTVTFGAEKRGLRTGHGVDMSGAIQVASLGFRVGFKTGLDARASVLERSDATIPLRRRQMHKGTAGRVGLVAGSPGMSGAAALCAQAAFRGGAGLVRLWSRGERHVGFPELMHQPFEDADRDALNDCHAIGIGPGVGQGDAAVIRHLVLETDSPMVVDADALTCFAAEPESLRARPHLVLTPHPGEASRLLGCDTQRVESDRFAAAEELANSTGQVVVLKGACSIIASPGQSPRVCPFGSSALATAGSGDVLTGLIAALLVHLSPLEAATTGVIVHALAGEHLKTDRGILAREIADAVPAVMRELHAAAT
ncbi:MAG: NAD(P)H-hydrate dehydratase [Polyangiales bacterium]